MPLHFLRRAVSAVSSRRVPALVALSTAAGVCYVASSTPVGLSRRRSVQCEQQQIRAEQPTAYERWKQDKIGFYENRLRMYSHPQKVFQYFASVCQGPPGQGPYFMTPADFIRSLMPYSPVSAGEHPSTERAEWTAALNDISKMADTDGDGLISLQEYLLFLTILSTPENLFQLAFKILDQDGNGRLDAVEFARVVSAHSTAINSRLGTRQNAVEMEQIKETSELSGMMAYMFGKTGNRQLSFGEFSKFVKKLQYDLLRCEFFQYTAGSQNTIGAKEFACAVLTYSHPSRVDQYMKRIDTLPNDQGRISFEEFAAFDRVAANMTLVSQALLLFAEVQGNSGQGVTRPQLKKVLRLAADVDITNTQIEVLFHLFDDNGDGFLNPNELVDALKGRSFRGLDQPRDLGMWRKLERVWQCVKSQ